MLRLLRSAGCRPKLLTCAAAALLASACIEDDYFIDWEAESQAPLATDAGGRSGTTPSGEPSSTAAGSSTTEPAEDEPETASSAELPETSPAESPAQVGGIDGVDETDDDELAESEPTDAGVDDPATDTDVEEPELPAPDLVEEQVVESHDAGSEVNAELDAGTTKADAEVEPPEETEPEETEPPEESDPPPTPECETDWEYDEELELCVQDCSLTEERGPTGRCYFVGSQSLRFASAEDTCEDRGDGWTLVTPRTEEEDVYITSIITEDTWIGATDRQVTNLWRWVDDNESFWQGNEFGSPVNGAYANWGNGEPSAANDEACARYHGSPGAFRWSDGDCSDFYTYACQGPEPVDPSFDEGWGTDNGGWGTDGTWRGN